MKKRIYGEKLISRLNRFRLAIWIALPGEKLGKEDLKKYL